MANNLVARLRSAANWQDVPPAPQLLIEAADEIERLGDALTRLAEVVENRADERMI